MLVTLKLFAIYQEAYGIPEKTLDLPSQTTVNQVLDQILTEKPHLRQWQSVTRFGVNLTFVDGDTILQEGDELVLIPPVSGG